MWSQQRGTEAATRSPGGTWSGPAVLSSQPARPVHARDVRRGRTIVGGTPTRQGTFTFTVHVTPFGASAPSTNGTYSITVGPPPPLTITFPSPCCNAGTVGSAYFQNFFSSGGIGPFTWTATAGKLPPGVVLTGSHLGGTPTVAGTFTFTIKVTDSAGDQVTEPGSITISP